MIRTKKEFVRDLTCDELCSISEKRSMENGNKAKRVRKMARREMVQKLCPPCYEDISYT